MNKNQNTIGLWRNQPVYMAGKTELPISRIFPSGRQALTHSLRLLNLGRYNRVAIPEWSSHCVISAVGKVATPIPLTEVIANNLSVDGILIYEQWGWPITEESKHEIKNRFKNKIIIFDTVDSADFEPIKATFSGTIVQILSLSKILGLLDGGLACINGQYLEFVSTNDSIKVFELLKGKEFQNNLFLNFIKNDVNAISPSLHKWLHENDLFKSIHQEKSLRHKNLNSIVNHDLLSRWPTWMNDCLAKGAAPGIIPLFLGESKETLIKIKREIMKNYNVCTEIYHFNSSGDPLSPKYQQCIAFPVHGLMSDLPSMFDSLSDC